jgi:hypothetical protein
MSISAKVRGLRKGRKIVIPMSQNAAAVTAWRALGAGNYTTHKVGKNRTEVRRLA